MASTGEYKVNALNGPLKLTANQQVRPVEIRIFKRDTTPHTDENINYCDALTREKSKFLANASDWKVFSAKTGKPVQKLPILELSADDIVVVQVEMSQRPMAAPLDLIDFEIISDDEIVEDAHMDYSFFDASEQDNEAIDIINQNTPTPRGIDFSPETHIKVLMIPKTDTDVEEITPDLMQAGRVTWMHKDMLNHYLTIQQIERRREVMQSAYYTSTRH